MKRCTLSGSPHSARLKRIALSGALATLLASGAAWADDSEIFVSQTNGAPNIMLILDTSGSMIGEVTTQSAFDPARDYVSSGTGDCAGKSGKVFFRTGTNQGTAPACNTVRVLSYSNLRCAQARTALASSAGRYQGDKFIQWRQGSGSTRRWRDLQDGTDMPVECRNDDGVDGDLQASNPYPDSTASSGGDTAQWTGTATNSYWDDFPTGGISATFYSANYVVWYNQFRTSTLGTRLSVMQQAARELVNSLSNVNVGLMRYSVNVDLTTANDASGDAVETGGGMVVAPIQPISQNRAQLISLIDGLVAYGSTPLSETLYEAHQYYSGGTVRFGNTSYSCSASTATSGGTTTSCSGSFNSVPSTAGARTGGSASATTYASPATDSCAKNFIVYLTDGEPTSDHKVDTDITTLTSASTIGTACATDGEGKCLARLAEYMFETDLRGTAVAGDQNVTTFFIGFGSTFGGTSNAAFDYLKAAGQAGGGDAFQANDLGDLTNVLSEIFASILDRSTTLTAPTVAVNAFNRTRTLDDLYVSVFQPAGRISWPGNVKKYGVDTTGKITDKTGQDAVDPTTGFFRDPTSDVWSDTTADGARVTRGGAANKIVVPGTRKVYTHLGANPGTTPADLTATARAFTTGNTALVDALFGTNTTDPLLGKLINWTRGQDVNDDDGDSLTDDARFAMGDPMHSQPGIVVYGGTTTTPDTDDAVVFATTNEGYLHAIDAKTGVELWAFLPQEMFPRLRALYLNATSATRNYGLDGNVRVLKYDVNSDGIVNGNDRVLVFFSTGRSTTASRYYAVDVTTRDQPKFLWALGPTELPALGQTWSTPTIARVNISLATQNSQKLVLIFGGGYDASDEGIDYVQSTVGNRIFMVDAVSGALLWTAAPTSDAYTLPLELARMQHAIPAAITVLDLDGDSFADRMYAGDLGGQLWRFDIYNGQAATALVTGGVMASLGSYDETTHLTANTRRFYNAPDAAGLQLNNGPPIINLAIGSGHRGRPLSTAAQDRFYSVRDLQPFTKRTQADYNDTTLFPIITEADLLDLTTDLTPTVPANSKGWLIKLNQPSSIFKGEKILSSSNTFDNTIFFTSYTPSASATSNTCTVAAGSNRAYAISAFDATPRVRRDAPTPPPNTPPAPPEPPSPEDRYRDLYQGGIAPEITFLFPDKDKVVCLSGVEVLSVCTDFNSRVKTYWRESDAQ